jgi:hypothetical protein
MKRGLQAGASNIKQDKSRVSLVLIGKNIEIENLIQSIRSGMKLNSQGAQVRKVLERGYAPKRLLKLDDDIEEDDDIDIPKELKGIIDSSAKGILGIYEVSTENMYDFAWKDGIRFYL